MLQPVLCRHTVLFCSLGDVSVGIKWDSSAPGEQEADVDFDIIPNANDTFTVKYVPPAAGRLTVKVLFTDEVRAGDRNAKLRGFKHLWMTFIVLW